MTFSRKMALLIAPITPMLLAPEVPLCPDCDIVVADVQLVKTDGLSSLIITVENIGEAKTGAWLDLYLDAPNTPKVGSKADVSVYTGTLSPRDAARITVDLAGFTPEPEKREMAVFALLDEGADCDDWCLDGNLAAFEVNLATSWLSDVDYGTPKW